MLLKDKVLIITGVGPGMGRKMAVIGAAEGAKVALAARSKDFVEQVTAMEARAKVIAVTTRFCTIEGELFLPSGKPAARCRVIHRLIPKD